MVVFQQSPPGQVRADIPEQNYGGNVQIFCMLPKASASEIPTWKWVHWNAIGSYIFCQFIAFYSGTPWNIPIASRNLKGFPVRLGGTPTRQTSASVSTELSTTAGQSAECAKHWFNSLNSKRILLGSQLISRCYGTSGSLQEWMLGFE